jgi:hypothetical protein
VTEDVAAAVLGDKVAEAGTEAHVGDGILERGPHAGGEAFEEDEALAVEEVLAELG